MALDLKGPDWTVEIALDGGSGINEGLSHDLEGIEVHLTATIEKDFIHDETEESNR